MNEVPNIDSMLNSDLSGIDTDFPVLEAGVVSGIIAECSRGETKEAHKPVLNLRITTSHPTRTTKGIEKPAGFPLRDMVSLTPTFKEDGVTLKYDPRQRLAQIKEAVFGNKEGPFGDPATYVGKPVTVRIKVESSDEFGMQNRVAAYVKLAQ